MNEVRLVIFLHVSCSFVACWQQRLFTFSPHIGHRMNNPTVPYSAHTMETLRKKLGGYPCLTSLPEGISDIDRLTEQIDASDRAFLRAGASLNKATTQQIYQPRSKAKFTSLEKSLVIKLKQDIWDAVSVILFRSSTQSY